MNVTFPKFVLSRRCQSARAFPAKMLACCAISLLLLHLPGSRAICQQQVVAANIPGQQTLLSAARKLESYQTIEAKIRVRTDLLGQPLVGTGVYAQLESTSGRLLRMELAIQAGQQTTSVKQISDGRNLWEHWQIGNSERVNHIDLGRVNRLLRKHPHAVSMSSSSLASGGLPKLLAQLATNFDFSEAPVRPGSLGGIEVLVITGKWRPEKLAAAAPNAVKEGSIDYSRLPIHVPHQVELVVGKDELFPYRVTYQKRDDAEPDKLLPVVTTEFYEVSIDRQLDPAQFHYEEPTHLTVAEQTELYLQSMGISSKPTPSTQR